MDYVKKNKPKFFIYLPVISILIRKKNGMRQMPSFALVMDIASFWD